MTIERFLRRGQFPILPERPLDESETTEPATARVFVVTVGAYSDRYIDAIFTTRDLAETYVAERQRRSFERGRRKAYREVLSWSWTDLHVEGSIEFGGDGVAVLSDGRKVRGKAKTRRVRAETFEEFVKRHTWNEFGDVEEYDLWDVLPVVEST